MSELKSFPLPYTKDPAKLAPSAFVEKPIKASPDFRAGDLMRLEDEVIETLSAMGNSDVLVTRDEGEITIPTKLKLVRKGQEKLVFVVEQVLQPGERPKQRNFVVKVDYLFGMMALDRAISKGLTKEAAIELTRTFLVEEALRQTEAWRDLRAGLPDAHIPTIQFSLKDAPISQALLNALNEVEEGLPKIPFADDLPESLPLLISQQRQDRFPHEERYRADITCVPFWSQLKTPEGYTDFEWGPEKEALKEHIRAVHEGLVKGVEPEDREEMD